jgi:hypothetical protein
MAAQMAAQMAAEVEAVIWAEMAAVMVAHWGARRPAETANVVDRGVKWGIVERSGGNVSP